MSGTVLVTGASRGIGRAIALRLARDGYGIVVHYNSRRDAAEQVAAEVRALGREVRLLQFDVSQRAAVASALTADMEANGAYYGVVCNAGIARDAAFPAMTGEEWDFVIRTNLDSFYNVLQPVVMPMVRRRAPGRIVTLASVSGIIGNRGQANYSAAKGGHHCRHQGAGRGAGEARDHRELRGARPHRHRHGRREHAHGEDSEMIPMQRIGKPDEVAGAVSFLMSPDAAYVTRQVIAVNGGLC